MTGIYYVEAADWLRAVGLNVIEYRNWQTRARSSGGFRAAALGCQWHHTAGSGSNPQGDCAYMWDNASDRPIGNGYIACNGDVWLGAAGCANTAGKGGPVTLSRGTVPVDSGNTTTWAWEVANNGVGQAWPQIQVDAIFLASNTMNAHFGNLPADLFTHALGAGDGYTDRKIDPAVAGAVQGPWKPRSVNSSGTWSQADIRAEATRRSSTPTPPTPEDEVTDDDINKIADRTVDKLRKAMTTDPPTGKSITFEQLWGYTRHNAANADVQTRPK